MDRFSPWAGGGTGNQRNETPRNETPRLPGTGGIGQFFSPFSTYARSLLSPRSNFSLPSTPLPSTPIHGIHSFPSPGTSQEPRRSLPPVHGLVDSLNHHQNGAGADSNDPLLDPSPRASQEPSPIVGSRNNLSLPRLSLPPIQGLVHQTDSDSNDPLLDPNRFPSAPTETPKSAGERYQAEAFEGLSPADKGRGKRMAEQAAAGVRERHRKKRKLSNQQQAQQPQAVSQQQATLYAIQQPQQQPPPPQQATLYAIQQPQQQPQQPPPPQPVSQQQATLYAFQQPQPPPPPPQQQQAQQPQPVSQPPPPPQQQLQTSVSVDPSSAKGGPSNGRQNKVRWYTKPEHEQLLAECSKERFDVDNWFDKHDGPHQYFQNPAQLKHRFYKRLDAKTGKASLWHKEKGKWKVCLYYIPKELQHDDSAAAVHFALEIYKKVLWDDPQVTAFFPLHREPEDRQEGLPDGPQSAVQNGKHYRICSGRRWFLGH